MKPLFTTRLTMLTIMLLSSFAASAAEPSPNFRDPAMSERTNHQRQMSEDSCPLRKGATLSLLDTSQTKPREQKLTKHVPRTEGDTAQ